MQEFINSDLNLTMLATQAFDDILDQIRSSSLNFHVQISPFSAVISLKKSLRGAPDPVELPLDGSELVETADDLLGHFSEIRAYYDASRTAAGTKKPGSRRKSSPDESEPGYEVHRIINHTEVDPETGSREYEVKWKGTNPTTMKPWNVD